LKFWFVILAVSLLTLYSPYLVNILRGQAADFEERLQQEMLLALSDMENPWRLLIPVIVVALALEAAYFVSAWLAVDRVAFRGLTLGFAVFEVYHLGRTGWFLRKFLRGSVGIDRLIVWSLERSSALVLSFHAILGLLLIIWP